jgi:hypothetical protein
VRNETTICNDIIISMTAEEKDRTLRRVRAGDRKAEKLGELIARKTTFANSGLGTRSLLIRRDCGK